MRHKLLLLFCFGLAIAKEKSEKPNIIFILADDLGYNDVPWHNSEVVAPNLESLAREGVILSQSYVQPICSPTRSALLSGSYPFTIGRQRGVIWPMMPTGLTLKSKIIPEYLKALGYSNHAIGKWHLGFCKWSYTPTERGFDTFRGYYTGSEDYYTKMRTYYKEERIFGEAFKTKATKPDSKGLDYRNNKEPCNTTSNIYSTYDYVDHFDSVVRHRNTSSPIFIYMAFQSVHSPREVPSKYLKPYLHIKNRNRRIYLGMVSALDDAVGKLVKSLKDSGIYENSVIIFSTDNGGPTITGGNNWPLRGNKSTIWEGGTRGAAFIHSTLLPKKGVVFDQLIHTTDWLATLVSLAGGKPPSNIDGLDQWQALLGKRKSPRKEIIYNIDKSENGINAGIRVGHYKLLVGDPGPGEWTPPPESTGTQHSKKMEKNSRKIVNRIVHAKHKWTISKELNKCRRHIGCRSHIEKVLLTSLNRIIRRKSSPPPIFHFIKFQLQKLKKKFKDYSVANRIKRGVHLVERNLRNATLDQAMLDFLKNSKIKLRLYNLKKDPEERHNLALKKKSTLMVLMKRLLAHMDRYVPPDYPPDEPKANPKFWNGVWSPGWCS